MYTSVCAMANISYKMFQNVGKQRGAKSSNKYVHGNESVRFHNVPVDTLNTFNHFLFCEKSGKLSAKEESFFQVDDLQSISGIWKKNWAFQVSKLTFTLSAETPNKARKKIWLKCDWHVTENLTEICTTQS